MVLDQQIELEHQVSERLYQPNYYFFQALFVQPQSENFHLDCQKSLSLYVDLIFLFKNLTKKELIFKIIFRIIIKNLPKVGVFSSFFVLKN